MRKTLLGAALVAAVSCVIASPARAEDLRMEVPAPPVAVGDTGRTSPSSACCPPTPNCPPPCFTRISPCTWRVEVSLGGWVSGVKGHETVRGRRIDLDASPLDAVEALLDHGEGWFQGRARISRGPWTLRLAGSHATLGTGFDLREGGTRGIEAEISVGMLQADLAWRWLQRNVGGSCDCPDTMSAEALVGVRYWDLSGSIEPRGALPGVSGSKDFVDPLVGARVSWNWRNRWTFDLEGDIGGFGVGSELTWGLRAGARYRFSSLLSAEIGYKVIDVDYADGDAATRFEYDIRMYGPYLVLNFHF